ncbi:hypothetical protein BGZ74_002462, partial [Mortierella antarctica]
MAKRDDMNSTPVLSSPPTASSSSYVKKPPGSPCIKTGQDAANPVHPYVAGSPASRSLARTPSIGSPNALRNNFPHVLSDNAGAK